MKVVIDDVEYAPLPPVCADASPLETRMYVEDIGEDISLRGYLHALLATLWNEGEGFSGKRPFGNSGWDYTIYAFLVKSGAVKGKIHENGDLGEFDKDAANVLMPGLIAAAMGYAKQ